MGKTTCLHQQKARISLVWALLILIILTGRWPIYSQEIKNLPSAQGLYILKDAEWIPIPEMKTTLQTLAKDTSRSWGILGIDSKPRLVIEDQNPIIIISGLGLDVKNITLSRLWRFERLRAQDFCGMFLDPTSFKKAYGAEIDSLQPFGKWTPVGM